MSSHATDLAVYAKSSLLLLLQVRENWKKSGNLSGQGKVRGKYFFGKVRENQKLVQSDVRLSG